MLASLMSRVKVVHENKCNPTLAYACVSPLRSSSEEVVQPVIHKMCCSLPPHLRVCCFILLFVYYARFVGARFLSFGIIDGFTY